MYTVQSTIKGCRPNASALLLPSHINSMVFFYLCALGLYKDTEKNFGVMKKGKYRPMSDFQFEFVSEVICCSSPQSSGFVIRLTPERYHNQSQISERYENIHVAHL